MAAKLQFPTLDTYRTMEDLVYEALREAICTGRLQPGAPIVVSQIADEMGVSRMPVTQTIRRLAAEGFVELIPHKGAVVAGVAREEVRELYAILARLEGLAAEEAASRVTEAELEELEALNEALRQAVERGEAGATLQADTRFHARVHRLAGLPRLERLVTNLRDQFMYYRSLVWSTAASDRAPSYAEHGAVLAALRRRDSAEAARLMEAHHLRACQTVLARLAARDGAARGG